MADIQLRLNKDMLVMSAPISSELNRLGMTSQHDQVYTLLFEPEVLEEIYKLGAITGAQCIVADTAMLTRARLAKLGMIDDGRALANNAMELVSALKPQHSIVEIGPCGLPLDPSSKASLMENRDQYSGCARLFDDASFDAFFLNGFTRIADLKCALMGVRKVSDKPLIASVSVDRSGVLARRPSVFASTGRAKGDTSTSQEILEDAVRVMADLGADVAGFATSAPIDGAVRLLERVIKACDLAALVQLDVLSRDIEMTEPTDENPYFEPDTMVDVADALRDAGAQFLRAIGDVTPAYTGALVAATDKLDVVRRVDGDEAFCGVQEDLDELADRLRLRVKNAMKDSAEQQGRR